jgi:hypothetical protein
MVCLSKLAYKAIGFLALPIPVAYLSVVQS